MVGGRLLCRLALEIPAAQNKEKDKRKQTHWPSPCSDQQRNETGSTQDPAKTRDRRHIETSHEAAHVRQQRWHNGPYKNAWGFFRIHEQECPLVVSSSKMASSQNLLKDVRTFGGKEGLSGPPGMGPLKGCQKSGPVYSSVRHSRAPSPASFFSMASYPLSR